MKEAWMDAIFLRERATLATIVTRLLGICAFFFHWFNGSWTSLNNTSKNINLTWYIALIHTARNETKDRPLQWRENDAAIDVAIEVELEIWVLVLSWILKWLFKAVTQPYYAGWSKPCQSWCVPALDRVLGEYIAWPTSRRTVKFHNIIFQL